MKNSGNAIPCKYDLIVSGPKKSVEIEIASTILG